MTLSVQTRVGIAIYLFLLAAYLVTASGHFYSTDHIQVYETTQSLVEDQSLVIPDGWFGFIGSDGETYSLTEPLQSVLSIPLYSLGAEVDDRGSESTRAYFSGPALDRWGGTVPIFFVSLFNQLLTPLICVVVYLFCLKLGFSIKASALTALIYGLGTMAFVGAHEYFQHPMETLFILSTMYVLYSSRNRLRLRDTLLAGTLLGLGLLTRLNVILIAPLLFTYLVWLLVNRAGAPVVAAGDRSPVVARIASQLRTYAARAIANWQYLAAFTIPPMLAFAVLLGLNEIRSGDWLTFKGGAEGGNLSPGNLPAGLYGNFFSPGRSIFLYSLPMIAGVFVFPRFFKAHTALAVLFLGVSAVYLLLYSSYDAWHGAGCFGPRYLTAIVPFFVIPAAYLFERVWSTIALAALAIAGTFIAVLGTVVNPVYAEQWRGLWEVSAGNAYLYTPDISPIVVHYHDFFDGRSYDLWLQHVLHQNGTEVLLLTLSVPAGLVLAAGLLLLTCIRQPLAASGHAENPATPEPHLG
jgi:hypothetical protein